MNTYTHQDLCEIAAQWLTRPLHQNGAGCYFSFKETKNNINKEIVDAVGFKNSGKAMGSVLIEVKVSRSDFLTDKKKEHRHYPRLGVGQYRYYFAPAGLISIDELPERWGLIEINTKGKIKVQVGHVCGIKKIMTNSQIEEHLSPWKFERNVEAELSLVSMVVARINDSRALEDKLKELNRLRQHNQDLWDKNNQLTTELVTSIDQQETFKKQLLENNIEPEIFEWNRRRAIGRFNSVIRDIK